MHRFKYLTKENRKKDNYNLKKNRKASKMKIKNSKPQNKNMMIIIYELKCNYLRIIKYKILFKLTNKYTEN